MRKSRYAPPAETPAGLIGRRRPALRDDLAAMARAVRRRIVEHSFRAGVGHIGSSLSVADVLTVLWGKVLRLPATDDPDRDLFVLCKGHAALALYAAMRTTGIVTETQLDSFCQDGSVFGVHPEFGVPGVEVTTGSLGQGLSVACGLALGLRLKRKAGRVFALLSDAECNEGQVWEAAQFATQHRLDNLVIAIDFNGMQALGPTAEILDLSPMSRKWQAFGWQTVDVDGHNLPALVEAFEDAGSESGRPTAIIARTSLGKGVGFMEDRLEWHYRNLTPELYAAALRELEEPT